MRIHNTLPLLISCLERWEKCPDASAFEAEFVKPISAVVGDFFEDFHSVLLELDWKSYRDEALRLDPRAEEARLRKHLAAVEDLFGFALEGDVFLIGAFEAMDGYARFDRGTHRVFLGVDESHARGKYLDILMVHELTHVARESRPETWLGWGLDPKMSQSEFTRLQPVVEHLFGEGFSCSVSELLVPGEPDWLYCYQDEQSFRKVELLAPRLDQRIHREIQDPQGHYRSLYGIEPIFAHYVWGWKWVNSLIAERGRDGARELLTRCSKDFIERALAFSLHHQI